MSKIETPAAPAQNATHVGGHAAAPVGGHAAAPVDDNILRAEKRKKLGELRAAGIDPYPHTFDRNS